MAAAKTADEQLPPTEPRRRGRRRRGVKKRSRGPRLFHVDCPLCGGPVRRVRRRLLDRLPALLQRTRRYRCRNVDCRWEGTLSTGLNPTSVRFARWSLLLAAVLVAALIATFVVTEHLSRDRPAAEYDQ